MNLKSYEFGVIHLFITAFYLLIWLFITDLSGIINTTANWQEYALAIGTIIPVVASMYSLKKFLPADLSIIRFIVGASVPPVLAVAYNIVAYAGALNLTQVLAEILVLIVYVACTYFLLNHFTK